MSNILCKACGKMVDMFEDTDSTCRSVIAQYGSIVLADVYHKEPCGNLILKDFVVDGDGLIPPAKSNRW